MPADMKRQIAEATRTLLMDRHVKKLTVKDIVEECHITRQAFYYHFEGIPELFRWMTEGYFERVMRETMAKESIEDGLRCFFVMAINAIPYFEHGLGSNYGEELERLLREYFLRYFETASEQRNFFQHSTRAEQKIILRYHSQAIMGMLREWTEEDTERLDEIVHTVYRIIIEGVPSRVKVD